MTTEYEPDFEKIEVHYTVKKESGATRKGSKMLDGRADTPFEAVNLILQQYSSPRGERVVSIDKIEINATPPVQPGEDRRMEMEETGVLLHKHQLNVEK